MNTLVLADRWRFPLLNIFLTMMWFFLWILWIFLLVRIVSDVFRSHDLSGLGKAGWTLFIIILPFLGFLMYLIFRGGSLHSREVRQAQQADGALRTYVRQPTGAGTSEELTKLAALRDQGVLTDEEFAVQKARGLH